MRQAWRAIEQILAITFELEGYTVSLGAILMFIILLSLLAMFIGGIFGD